MFDAKNLLDLLVKGSGAPSGGGAAAGGGLADILGGLGLDGGAGAGRTAGGAAPAGGLDDLLRGVLGGGSQAGGGSAATGGLGDILGKLGLPAASAAPGQQGGGLADILGQVLGQATDGVKDGAQRIDQSTDLSGRVRDLVGQLSGRSPEEVLRQVQELIAGNQLGTGAVLGGLGAILLGTRSGRSVAAGAAKMGALALIGGLAWKAYQNYTEGKPLITGRGVPPAPAPQGSGFEPEAVSNAQATTFIRAMIAAAASDGRLDDAERQRILGGMKTAGVSGAAEQFLARELAHPASPEELAGAVGSPEEAVQLYTAARLAIEVDTTAEQSFLAALAAAANVDPALSAHVDAAARAA
ncbi:MAG: tellurite resistance TerB family protein [Hyphomicrobiaceae bacterium]